MKIKIGDVVVDPEIETNIYTVISVFRKHGVQAFRMRRWKDKRIFLFDCSASNSYFKKVGRMEDE